MKLYGIGTDIVNIKRITAIIKKNNLFKKKVFSVNEIKFCDKKNNIYSCYAKRFAAKEAFSKALGTGVSNGLIFREIIVQNDKKGKPSIKICGKSRKIVKTLLNNKQFNILLSMSDDKPFATAVVIISFK